MREKKEWATTTVRIFFNLLVLFVFVSGATSRVFFFLFLDDHRGVKEEEEREKEQTIVIVVKNKSVDFRGRRSGGDFRNQFDALVDSAVPNSSLSTGGFER